MGDKKKAPKQKKKTPKFKPIIKKKKTVKKHKMGDKKTAPKDGASSLKDKTKKLAAEFKKARESDALKMLRHDHKRLANELMLNKTKAQKAERDYAASVQTLTAEIVAEARRSGAKVYEVTRASKGNSKVIGHFTSTENADERIKSEEKIDKNAGKSATYKTSSFVPKGDEKIEVIDVTTSWLE